MSSWQGRVSTAVRVVLGISPRVNHDLGRRRTGVGIPANGVTLIRPTEQWSVHLYSDSGPVGASHASARVGEAEEGHARYIGRQRLKMMPRRIEPGRVMVPCTGSQK